MKMWLSAQPKSFSQPEANPYLTTDFSLLEHKAEDGNQLPDIPTQIGDPNEGFSLWYRGDNKFRLPKAIISFYLVSPIVTDSAKRYQSHHTTLLPEEIILFDFDDSLIVRLCWTFWRTC